MGLDEFMNDGESKTSSSDNNSNDDKEKSGLDAFMDNPQAKADRTRDGRSNPWMDDLSPSQWNSMSVKEKIQYVRYHYDPYYRSDIDLAPEMDYVVLAKTHCKECKHYIEVEDEYTCSECGTKYARRGDTLTIIEQW